MLNKRKSTSATQSTTEKKQVKLTGSNHGDEPISSVENLYGMKMPKDLKHFWKLCMHIDPKNPLDSFSFLNWRLVGPFYFLHHKSEKAKKSPVHYHMKWRYYYDTPEFLTVIASTNPDEDYFHIGYFRDNPSASDECIVVSNSGLNAHLSIIGDNLFTALNNELCDAEKKASGKLFEKIKRIKEKIKQYANEENFCLTAKSDVVNRRRKRVVATAFHKIGLVVPIVDDVGYRPLPRNNAQLQRIFNKVDEANNDEERLEAFEPLQEIVTFVQFANDECDYGMGLEFGIALFCHGSKYLFKMSEMLLTMAFGLLKMDLYAEICKAHFADRRKSNVSREDI